MPKYLNSKKKRRKEQLSTFSAGVWTGWDGADRGLGEGRCERGWKWKGWDGRGLLI